MRAYIVRSIAGIGVPRRRVDRGVRLVPGSGRPRRARATFIAVENRTALAH